MKSLVISEDGYVNPHFILRKAEVGNIDENENK